MELLAKIIRRKAGGGWLDNRSTHSNENFEVAQACGSIELLVWDSQAGPKAPEPSGLIIADYYSVA